MVGFWPVDVVGRLRPISDLQFTVDNGHTLVFLIQLIFFGARLIQKFFACLCKLA